MHFQSTWHISKTFFTAQWFSDCIYLRTPPQKTKLLNSSRVGGGTLGFCHLNTLAIHVPFRALCFRKVKTMMFIKKNIHKELGR